MCFPRPSLTIDEDGGLTALDGALDILNDLLENFLLCCLFREDFSELKDLELCYLAFHADKIAGCQVARFASFRL